MNDVPSDDGPSDNGPSANGMTDDGRPPVRQVVRRDPTRASALRPVRELAERTTVGEIYLASLIRTQLTLALRLMAVVAVVLGGVPLLYLLEPRLRPVKAAGIPLAWLIVGVGFYPLFLAIAVSFVRRTERNEADFVELVAGTQPGSTSPLRSER